MAKWEYSVIHQKKWGWIVVQGEGEAKSHLKVKFNSPIKKGWKRTGDLLKGAKKTSAATITTCHFEAQWNAEKPVMHEPGQSPTKDWVALRFTEEGNQKEWVEIFGAEVKSAEWVVSGWATSIYEAETVTQLLNVAGADGWELVGNVPGGENRMLRREL